MIRTKKMMTVGETAEYLGVQPYWVRRLIREDKLIASRHPTSYKWEVDGRRLKTYSKNRRKVGRPSSETQD